MTQARFDQHIHSSFSYDAEPDSTMSGIIGAAIAKGLAGIAICDHLDPLWPDDKEPSVIDIPAYEEALNEAAASLCDNRLQFAKGIELGLMPGEALNVCRQTVTGYPYDFVIASVHSSSVAPLDYPAFLEGRPLKSIIDEYYTLLFESLKTYKDYDVIGHINHIDRYTDGFAPEEMYMPYADEILKLIVQDGKGLEINTSSYRYGIEERGTPSLPILKRFFELGGEILTIGSDAHKIGQIGAFLEEGERLLRATGFRYFAVFKERQPEFFRL